MCVKIGDNEIPYNKKFMLYITTRMQNPHYTPEVSTKVNVVNFNVKESGLEDQCLNIVVGIEQPNLEQTKNEVVERIATNKKLLQELEDQILDRLRKSEVNLLEDLDLSAALTQSKETTDEVKVILDQSELTMKRINETRNTFKPVAKKASALFFVLNDLSKINPMYQFSLKWYKDLFAKSIKDSKDQG
jgi:dynein heavy chain